MNNPVVIVGEGPNKVLALHGWLGSARSWGPLVDVLDTSAFSYAFMDFRGYGARMGEPGDYSLSEVAQDALDAADELGWEKFSLLGHSMGGAAIQHVLAAQPQRVRAMVGVSPVPASGVPFDPQTMAFFETAAGEASVRRTIVERGTGGRHSRRWVDLMVANSFERSTEQAVGAYLQAWAKTNIADKVRGIEVPVHIIVGQYDGAINEAFVRNTWLTHYPVSSVEVMPNAGHYAMDETPVALATSIEKFLGGLPESA